MPAVTVGQGSTGRDGPAHLICQRGTRNRRVPRCEVPPRPDADLDDGHYFA